MKIVKGKKILSIHLSELRKLILGYRSIVVDIGTGDGRFIYKLAKNQPQSFFIGIDPEASNLAEYSSKIYKKSEKGGLSNVLYVVASIEDLPQELNGLVKKIYINLPWGNLLEGIVKTDRNILANLKRISTPDAELEILITYSVIREAGEIKRRALPELTLEYIKKDLTSPYKEIGIKITKIEILDREILREVETQWAKKLGYGRKRDIFWIKAKIER